MNFKASWQISYSKKPKGELQDPRYKNFSCEFYRTDWGPYLENYEAMFVVLSAGHPTLKSQMRLWNYETILYMDSPSYLLTYCLSNNAEPIYFGFEITPICAQGTVSRSLLTLLKRPNGMLIIVPESVSHIKGLPTMLSYSLYYLSGAQHRTYFPN